MAAVCGSTLQHARPARVAASQSRGLASSAAVAGRPLPKAASVACRAAPVRVCAAAAPSQQKIRIKLKSYWTDLLEVSVDMIKDAASSTGAAVSGPVNLPTK
jgi:small subunit ribosomal protein S10